MKDVNYMSHDQFAICSGGRRAAVAIAILLALILPGTIHAEETASAKITVSASPAGSYFGDRLIEGVMEFQGKKYLLTLLGTSGSAASVGSVFGLHRVRDIIGHYTATAGGLRNESGVTIRFDPPLAISGSPLHINFASRIYPKASTGQGSDLE
jgi:hypothetical protein